MESAQQQKELDNRKVQMQKLQAEAMTLVHDTVGSKEMTEDVIGRTITGTGQSSPNRPSIAPLMTASISEPVNTEERAADPQMSCENFPVTAILSPNDELTRVEESAIVLAQGLGEGLVSKPGLGKKLPNTLLSRSRWNLSIQTYDVRYHSAKKEYASAPGATRCYSSMSLKITNWEVRAWHDTEESRYPFDYEIHPWRKALLSQHGTGNRTTRILASGMTWLNCGPLLESDNWELGPRRDALLTEMTVFND
ncbi:hypothetical protein FXO38_08056 [Capsicum annuum]|nr:hypothetical protein FXO38_08056 [Capsicum annuum]